MQTAFTSQPPDLLKLLANKVRWQLVSALTDSDYRVLELVHLLGQPFNLISYHLKKLREAQVVNMRRSDADGRDLYYSLDLDLLQAGYLAAGQALHPALGIPPTQTASKAVRVLFLCTGNSARSQMAEGLLRHLGGDQVEVYSAGSQPATLHPQAVKALAKIGVDISAQRAKHLDEFRGQRFDYVITVCDRVREVCPTFPGDPQTIHWSFADPAALEDGQARARAFAQTAQQLATRIRYLKIFTPNPAN